MPVTKVAPDTEEDKENTATTLNVDGSETADGRDVKLTAQEVRQGHTGDHVRKILAISGIGAAIALLAAFYFRAAG